MPTYEYACRDCGEHLEIVQSFRDDPLSECPACGGPLRKVFGAIGIAFKGSGFYKNDSRSASATRTKPKADGADSSKSGESSKSADASNNGASNDGGTKGGGAGGDGAKGGSKGDGGDGAKGGSKGGGDGGGSSSDSGAKAPAANAAPKAAASS
ncbi:MAG: FmdB family zinc ribbon protein [Acidimicrobiales bacterium]